LKIPATKAVFHWLLLRATGDENRVEEHSASEEAFSNVPEAFHAGVAYWEAAMNKEDEDADPVGNPHLGGPNET
jgi:hypothetical protein